jgi:DNA sulfur modification protein DndC
LYPDEQLLAEMQRALLDTEAKAAAISNKKNVIVNFEREIKKAFYRDEAEAEQIASTRAIRISGITDEASPDDFVD